MDKIKGFLDSEGRLKAFPAKRKMKAYALLYLSQKIENGTKYTEKQFNELLNSWHTFGDAATLRRELYNNKFIDRTSSGSEYWREDILPTEQDIDEKYK